MKRKQRKVVNRLIRSIEPHSLGLGYIKIDQDTDPTLRFAVVCDFADGRYGKLREHVHQLELDKDGNEVGR